MRRGSRLGRMSARALLFACALSVSLLDPAHADAPHDITANQRLWLDGLDVYGTDTGNGGATNPASGGTVSGWKDKSGNAYTAGDATSYGAAARTYPTYTASSGVSFNGISDVLEIPGNIYGTTSVPQSEILTVASTRTVAANPILISSGVGVSSGNHMLIALPSNNGNIYYDHGSTSNGRLTVSWSTTGLSYGQYYLYDFFGDANGTNMLVDGSGKGNRSSPAATYLPDSTHYFNISGGEKNNTRSHDGVVSEVLVYTRILKAAERNILNSYLAAKYNNPGGAGTTSRYTVTNGYRYHVGGIGSDTDGRVDVGTSAGLQLENPASGGILAAGNYFLAGTDALNPATGVTTANAPTGGGRRSQRIWYIHRTGSTTGSVTMKFDLAKMGISLKAGDKMTVAWRSNPLASFMNVSSEVIYSGSGTVSFSIPNPPSGYYVLGLVMSTGPNVSATTTSTIQSDGVNASTPKAIPGALLHVSVNAVNSGLGSPDANTSVLNVAVPPATKLFVGDIGAAGAGPVLFTQGTTSSGLTYTYSALASTTDGLEFSKDSGATWTYVPVPDAAKVDPAITNFRVKFGGTFANGTSPNYPSFTVKFGLVVK